MAENRVTQEFLEVGHRDAASIPADNARVTQAFVEVGYREPLVLDILGGEGEAVGLDLEFRMAFTGNLSNVIDIVSGDTYCHPRDVLLVLDRSTSMDGSLSGGLSRMEAAKLAALDLIGAMASSDTSSYMGLITFSHHYNDGFGIEGAAALLSIPPGVTNDWSALTDAVNAVTTGGYGTPTGGAITIARAQMEVLDASRPETIKCMILLTDGEWNLLPDPLPIVQDMVADHPDWLFYVVDVNGGTANPSNAMLGLSGNGFFSVDNVDDLSEALLQAGDPCGFPLPLIFPIEFGMEAPLEAVGAATVRRSASISWHR